MLLMIFTILGLCLYILDVFFEIYFDRNIMYLDQSTPRHQGQNRAFELELLKNQEFQYHFSSRRNCTALFFALPYGCL